jgi:DNA-binding protein YbaB
MHDHEFERLLQEAEQAQRDAYHRVSSLFDEMAGRQITGVSDDRLVSVRVDGRGRVVAMDIQPQGMRLTNQDLSRRILEALSAAQDTALQNQKDFLARRWAAEGGR